MDSAHHNAAPRQLADAVHQLGAATIDALQPRFSHMTRNRMRIALEQACAHGWVRVARPAGRGRNATPAVYEPLATPKAQRVSVPRVASVWDFAAGRAVAMPRGSGNRYQPLGAW